MGVEKKAKVVAAPYLIKNDKMEYCAVKLNEEDILINYKKGELDKPQLVDGVGAVAGSSLGTRFCRR